MRPQVGCNQVCFPNAPNASYPFIDLFVSLHEYKWISGSCEQFSFGSDMKALG